MGVGIIKDDKIIVTDEDGNKIELPREGVEAGMTLGWIPNASIERELGPQRREVPQETIAAFLEELTALSKKYGIRIVGEYEAPHLWVILPREESGAYRYSEWGEVEWDVDE